jgi:predicted AlkP superfamily phosphohydrolase/phosphomutase/tetratricopeptide (TPR) repeat protein
MDKRLAKKLLLIGWDGADWKTINTLLDAGKMPALERFVNSGVMGNLATLHPSLSPMLWTSIATGMRPFKHGIHGFTEPDPSNGGIRPVTSTSRTVKAVWNILNQSGYQSNVIGWWPSHPAEPINGVMVSNHYHRARGPLGKPWPMAPGTVHPAELSESIAGLRIHPAELTAHQILPFIPGGAEIDQEKDRRLDMVTRTLAECSTVHACATAVMQLEPWDFMAVYYDSIDHFSHGFMKYHPPRQKHISEEDFELYKGVVEGGYRFHDMMLGVLLKLAGEETTVILVSDHGFLTENLRPARIPHEPAGPAAEHSPYGIFAMKGPGIKGDELVFGSSLLDITPTVLTLFGLPVGEDMDGKPLVECFEAPPAIETIPSWEGVQGDAGLHPPDLRMDAADAREAINQLVALGYIEDPGEDKEKAVEKTVHEARYNLAQAYMDANRHGDALPLLEALWEAEPEELRFANRLANCYQALGRLPECRSTVEALIKTQARIARDARQKLKEHGRNRKEAKEEEDSTNEGLTEREKAEKRLLAEKEAREIQRLRALASPRRYWADHLMGFLLFAEDNPLAALEHLQRAEKAEPRLPFLHLQIGHIYLKLKMWDDAERAFGKAVEIDHDNAQAHLGLCQCHLARRRSLDAAEEALASVGLLYHQPQAHYYLGFALHRLGYIDQAVEALQVALSQNPNFVEPHKLLTYIYRFRIEDPEKAKHHRNQVKEIRRLRRKRRTGPKDEGQASQNIFPLHQETAQLTKRADLHLPQAELHTDPLEVVTVVSGLPRSGTSMMMQMLKAGGLACLTDNLREADADNPRGYFEFDKARRLHTDASWLAEAKGKTVKIIAQLLPFLPADYQYRVIFMERDIAEVLKSQSKMLDRQGRKGASLSVERLSKTFAQQVRQAQAMLAKRLIPTLYVPYRDALDRSRDVAALLRDFLGEGLDAVATANAVDRNLYRNRS